MKSSLLIVFALVSSNAFANLCPVEFGTSDYAGEVSAVIESQSTCEMASEMARACSLGSALDVEIVDAALKICDVRLPHASASVKNSVNVAKRLCEKKFARASGSIAKSALSYCYLDVSTLYHGLLSPAEL